MKSGTIEYGEERVIINPYGMKSRLIYWTEGNKKSIHMLGNNNHLSRLGIKMNIDLKPD